MPEVIKLKNQKIAGVRVYLRGLTMEDATDTYLNWLNDSEVTKFMATKHSTMNELKAFLGEKIKSSSCLIFGIFENKTDKHLGNIKLEPIDLDKGRAIIGIMVGDKSSWGKGVGFESMQLVIDWARNELGLDLLELGVLPENDAARGLYEKLGFKYVRMDKASVEYEDGMHDNLWMELPLRSED